MSELAQGGCLCGACRYEFAKDSVMSSFHCHCRDCRKTTGSGKSTIVLVPAAAVRMQGELKSYTVTGTEGAHVTRGFCPTCGSQVSSHVEEMPDLKMIKAGTLDDGSWLTVGSSCWGSSAEPWSPVDSDSPAFERNPALV